MPARCGLACTTPLYNKHDGGGQFKPLPVRTCLSSVQEGTEGSLGTVPSVKRPGMCCPGFFFFLLPCCPLPSVPPPSSPPGPLLLPLLMLRPNKDRKEGEEDPAAAKEGRREAGEEEERCLCRKGSSSPWK